MIHVDSALHHYFASLNVTLSAAVKEGCLTVSVDVVHVHSQLQQRSHSGSTSIPCCIVQTRLIKVICQLNLAALADQPLDHADRLLLISYLHGREVCILLHLAIDQKLNI